MGQLTIDTLDKKDRDNAMVSLHAIALNNGEESLFYPRIDYQELLSKFDVLNSDYQKCKEERDLYEEELHNENEKNSKLFEANKTLSAKIDEFILEKEKLTSEIKELKEKLSGFVVGYGVEGGNEIAFFKPEGVTLVTTKMMNNAYYIGALNGDSYEFQFNEEKAPHNKAIEARNTILLPFCVIESSANDANYVENVWKGSFSNVNGEFRIIEKARVRLIKK